MVALTYVTLAAALATQSAAQFFGLAPKDILKLVKVLPPAMVTPQLALAFNRQVNGNYGKIADKSSAIPRVQTLPARKASFVPSSKTVKVRYGPYTVPSMMKKNGLEDSGSLWNFPDREVPKPCETCILLGMDAGLEYADGTSANIDSDAWLHHMVLFNIGPGRVDPTCQTSIKSLPHILMGTTPQQSERIFASGNERVPFDVNWNSKSSTPAGYHLNAADKFAMIIDFMNEGEQDKTLYLTMTYDIVEGQPAGFDDVRVVWFDIDQCGFSEVMPTQEVGKFTINAKPWTSNVDGEVLGWFGHLHDGGVSISMELNGKTECVSEASYGGNPAFVQKKAMGNPNSATSHISNMTICAGTPEVKTQMKTGQVWNLKAAYNYDQHKGMLGDDGKQGEIMGISFMYVRQPRKA